MGFFKFHHKLSLTQRISIPIIALVLGMFFVQGFVLFNSLSNQANEDYLVEKNFSQKVLSDFSKNSVKVGSDGSLLEPYLEKFKSIHSMTLKSSKGSEVYSYKKKNPLESPNLESNNFTVLSSSGNVLWNIEVSHAKEYLESSSNVILFEAEVMGGSLVLLAIALFFLIKVNVQRISKNMRELLQYTQKLTYAGDDILNKVSVVTTNATDESAAVQETVSTLEEITSMVDKTMDRVGLSSKVSQKSQEAAVSGRKTVRETVNTMEIIKESNEKFVEEIEDSNQKLSEIVEVILNIESKTKVINDIVFQTKLLSFNASVEAARAGEHGKGFAVVAEEVGNLAQMSGVAAKEISEMLNTSVEKVSEITESSRERIDALVSENKHHMEVGMQMVQRSGDGLDDIVSNVDEVNEMNSDVLVASKEQAEGIDNISTAMSHLDEAIQLNVKTANQTVESVQEFKVSVEKLEAIVSEVSTELYGENFDLSGEDYDDYEDEDDVVSLDKEADQSTPTNVIPMQEAVKTQVHQAEPAPMKKAVGAPDLPDANDPRFDDI